MKITVAHRLCSLTAGTEACTYDLTPEDVAHLRQAASDGRLLLRPRDLGSLSEVIYPAEGSTLVLVVDHQWIPLPGVSLADRDKAREEAQEEAIKYDDETFDGRAREAEMEILTVSATKRGQLVVAALDAAKSWGKEGDRAVVWYEEIWYEERPGGEIRWKATD